MMFVCIASFTACCSIVGSFVLFRMEDYHAMMLLESLYMLSHSVVVLILVIWFAGQVPIEMSLLRSAFCENIECRMLLGNGIKDTKLEKALYDTPDIVLTGGNILYFKRSLILTVLGIILTYTFLLINTTQN